MSSQEMQAKFLPYAALLCVFSATASAQQAPPQAWRPATDIDLRPSVRSAGPDRIAARTQDIMGRYFLALHEAIERNWNRPQSIAPTMTCPVAVRQLPGGEVIALQVLPECEFDEAGRNSVEAAIIKAQPLPYRGFESVFQRTILLKFRAKDDAGTR